MHVITTDVNSAFETLIKLFQESPDIKERNSRNGPVMYLDEPVTVTYTQPTNRVLLYPNRNANPFFHLYESLWMLAGRRDVKPLTRYVTRMKEYSDDGEVLNGAYGYRWRKAENHDYTQGGWGNPEVDQLQILTDHLKTQPDSRRAVLQMWNVEDDLLRIENSKDVCCNLSILFSRDSDKLNMTVFNRSNDLIWGMLGANYVHFTMLQEHIAHRLDLQAGVYHHITNNLHVYKSNWNPVMWLSEKLPHVYTPGVEFRTSLIEVDSLTREFDNINEFVKGWDLYMSTTKRLYDNFSWAVTIPMLNAHTWYRFRNYERAMNSLSYVQEPNWRRAGMEWMRRSSLNPDRKENTNDGSE